MSISLSTTLRPSQLEEVLNQHLAGDRGGEILLNPAGGLFEAKNFAAALKKIGPGGRMLLAQGTHVCAEITKPISLRAQSIAAKLTGPIQVKTTFVHLAGLEIEAPAGQAILELKEGIVVLENCTIHGSIRAAGTARVFLKECLLGGGSEGILVGDKAVLEMHTSRVTGCRMGINLEKEAICALYDSRIDQCVTEDQSDWGVGVFGECAEFHGEAVTFQQNGIGLYLKKYRTARLMGCRFGDNDAAGIIAEGAADSEMRLRSCVFEGQRLNECAQVTVSGGLLEMACCTIRKTAATGLAASQVQFESTESRLESEARPALEMQGCRLAVEKFTAVSGSGAGLSATGCQGTIRDSNLTGNPPTLRDEGSSIIFDNCQLLTPGEAEASIKKEHTSDVDAYIDDLLSVITQENVRTEMERLLRLAHASQQREMVGHPLPGQNFNAVFAGPAGTAKLADATLFAEGLHHFGRITQPHVHEIDLQHLAANADKALDSSLTSKGVLFVKVRGAGGPLRPTAEAVFLLEKLAQNRDLTLILDGERDNMRAILRASPVLERQVRHFLYFPDHGPLELMSFFAQLCRRDHISLSPDAAVICLLLFHVHCDRKDRRYNSVEGVETVYEVARQRFLERCSRTKRFDLQLERQDVDLPQDKTLRRAVERSPAFVTFCPHCLQENPWVAGLEPRTSCLHCGQNYPSSWGHWTGSLTYRRTQESLNGSAGPGAISRRARPIAA